MYRRAGATIAASAREVFAASEMVVKVKSLNHPNGLSSERARFSSLICT